MTFLKNKRPTFYLLEEEEELVCVGLLFCVGVRGGFKTSHLQALSVVPLGPFVGQGRVLS